MRRQMFIFLVVLGVFVLGVRFWVNQAVPQNNPPGAGISFVEYNPLTPLANPPLAQLQNSLDRVSEAAMKKQWHSASLAVNQLEKSWQQLRSEPSQELEIEKGITNSIQALHYNVWGKDSQGVLITAQKLTDLINQLSN